MNAISIFDMLKIGVGPSSSHTLGPWRAAQEFSKQASKTNTFRVKVTVFGSLSLTGKGHATDIAILLGLTGADPVTFDCSKINETVALIKTMKRLQLFDKTSISFDFETDFIFDNTFRSGHANAMIFEAFDQDDHSLLREEYFSIGGGFISKVGVDKRESAQKPTDLPFPIGSAADLLKHCRDQKLPVSAVVAKNESFWRDKNTVDQDLEAVWKVMLEAMYDGCHTQGILPGGLEVKRRAFKTHEKLIKNPGNYSIDTWIKTIRNTEVKFREILKWVSCFALSVNEVNASLGRVVTAPTNGSAGVIPAVLMYYLVIENHNASFEHIKRFLLVAGEIGCIFKKNATISAAMGGCQAEIGVSSAMAAAALCELLGGSPEQVTSAAEIAMEHHLGMTCDPIGGLVQIPCIERNAMGAIKAINAAELALENEEDQARVSLDEVIQSMWETAQDMHSNYKETAQGGLAIAVNMVDC